MAIGGAEDKFRDRAILSTFLMLAGGPQSHLVIVPTASSIETSGERYKAIFLELGARSAEIVYIHDREHGNDPDVAAQFADATGIFMTGGNQLRLSTRIGGTLVENAIRVRHRHWRNSGRNERRCFDFEFTHGGVRNIWSVTPAAHGIHGRRIRIGGERDH